MEHGVGNFQGHIYSVPATMSLALLWCGAPREMLNTYRTLKTSCWNDSTAAIVITMAYVPSRFTTYIDKNTSLCKINKIYITFISFLISLIFTKSFLKISLYFYRRVSIVQWLQTHITVIHVLFFPRVISRHWAHKSSLTLMSLMSWSLYHFLSKRHFSLSCSPE